MEEQKTFEPKTTVDYQLIQDKFAQKHHVNLRSCNQSINQSIDVFQGKIQTTQFTNIYKHILF